MQKTFKKVGKWLLIVLTVILAAAVALVLVLTITEYRPEHVEKLDIAENSAPVLDKNTIRIVSWNTGYGGLDAGADFFMDGGKSVQSASKEQVQENMQAILDELSQAQADVIFLQETDAGSQRSYQLDQCRAYADGLNMASSYGVNYRCLYVPFPWPPIGQVDSGLQTLSHYAVEKAERISLPNPFSWPVRVANLKRCLLVNYLPIEGCDKQLVLVNLHLEAYDDGEGKLAQTKQFWEVIRQEYEKGNYVIAGGDFNQTFPGSLENFPILQTENWVPGALDSADLDEGWQYSCDLTVPTCRLLDKPYDAITSQCYVIDGFVLSPNVKLVRIENQDLGFTHSDHNPVYLDVELLP